MIVVDTNIISYFYLPTEKTVDVERLFIQQPEWAAPSIWRSEFRNVLALYLRKQLLTFDQAYAIQSEAEMLLSENEFEVTSFDVLRLVQKSNCSAYDCEFVALAMQLQTVLITEDKKILENFPAIAINLVDATK
ncbi:type II toxin-antitoxin system VapC family toxin [Dactylococcopsis salina]|uniref:Nucleic acid-binding protein, contains PIN domain n=1 Tax=Dactylococcopsis salina (strain PCC 8305) TaxID=13035 RepID=K9YVP0_DACS8|nr:type II toxin-antitoxin system VapC family toxin [Dactylococcopsis salina]AFZ50168.1 putative nucleic acid-binding protein, contains PIN domain [Dactylococcopsis salina PCC 8305]